MKLYDDKLAPNPRRVRIFLAEKGIEVPKVNVEIMKGEHKSDEYRRINPLSGVPSLELDDGSIITETVAICRYFEELHPETPLFGTDAKTKAVVEMWNRRMELTLFVPVAMVMRHTHPALAVIQTQFKDWGEYNKGVVDKVWHWLERELGDGREFIAGPIFTIADITALCAADFAKFARVPIPQDCLRLLSWHARVSERPSAKA
ncbi:MAG TPA: glutathione S-transferase [Alphaproteobacteria bacterium]|nr:glutathione S-transferase [Alphaproteobacteria bacterium]HAJ47626.1 glutathione S-transferase [Alphaproteobacteria bacterium]